jgi:spore germination protein GerM
VSPITAVPYDLMSPATSVASAPPVDAATTPQVYLVRDDVLVPVQASRALEVDVEATVATTLERLAEGPSREERGRGLSTALGPDVGIALDRLEGSTAVIDVRAGDQAPTGSRLPLAVGQIVLTALSVPGVESVLLTSEGEPIQAPLPGGALTDRPLVAGDYTTLAVPVTPRPSGTTAASATSG